MENLDVRVYPIDEPKGSTLAYANVAVDGLAAICGIRVVDGEKGLFVSMPQSHDNTGAYHDIAFPLTGDLRKEITDAVLDEYALRSSLGPEQRKYEKQEKGAESGRDAEDVKLGVRVFPIAEPKGSTLAFASVSFDDRVAVRGIRVVDGDKGRFVSMPQSKDKNGAFRDIAFPLTGDLRKAVSKAILAEYGRQTAEKKQSLGEQLREGKEASARYAAGNPAPARASAKKAPGLGD
jgi:stage V sporulation protein G